MHYSSRRLLILYIVAPKCVCVSLTAEGHY